MRLRKLLLIVAVLAPPAYGQELFGAIAYSTAEKKHGWANNYPSRKEAEEAALASCRKNAAGCRNLLWFRNACGALVTGPDGHGADWAKSQTAAVNKALKACATKSPTCAVTLSFCTGKSAGP